MWHFAKQGDYRRGIVLDYNYANPNPALNYAIFLHANKVATAGCVALDEAEVTSGAEGGTVGMRVSSWVLPPR